MPKSEAKGLSFRRPLRDVANNIGAGRFAVNNKKPIRRPIGDGLDRLLLLQSDISALLRQVDELVVQAFQLNSTGKQEVDSFANVLSEMLSSLKPWVPRFQKVLSSSSLEPESQSRNTLADKRVSAENEVDNEEPERPQEPNLDLLISPSPLVSWRANCTTEGGRQLFLLTPLPISKALSSKHQDPPKSVFERIDSDMPRKLFSFNSLPIDTKCDQLQGVETKPTPAAKRSDFLATATSNPMMLSKSKGSIVIMTPCLKRSPPKSCVLLEEISESSHKHRCESRRSTPFPVGLKGSDFDASESSSGSEASEDLASKFPELKGIHQAHKSVVTKKHIEESPDWFRSPPKSCVLLEPLNDETPAQVGVLDLQKSPEDIVESTPLCKEPQSTCQRGKRPGENTLKKELWTKFEAASSSGLNFNISRLGKSGQKGFLDLLDEVSCDGEI